MAKKTTCPISRAQFKQGAKPVEITIGSQRTDVPVKYFSTGSLGWYLNKKMTIEVGGQPVEVQIGLNMTIVGSKDLPQDEGAAAAPAVGAQGVAHGGTHGGAHGGTHGGAKGGAHGGEATAETPPA